MTLSSVSGNNLDLFFFKNRSTVCSLVILVSPFQEQVLEEMGDTSYFDM